ncbi:hypothetical protein [Roseivirga sp. E12]|nr:hypothetical protein [Roseivirga sp. E12]
MQSSHFKAKTISALTTSLPVGRQVSARLKGAGRAEGNNKP